MSVLPCRGQFARVAAQFQLGHDVAGQHAQRLLLLGAKRARDVVHDAQRAECVTVGRQEWRAGVETDLRIRRDERIVPEALVLRGGGGKTVACASCHGEDLKGTDKFPSLAGRSPGYLARQLYDFQHFTRVGPGSLLMQPVVRDLSEEDILNITAYVASLQP